MGWDAYAEPTERLWAHRDGRNGGALDCSSCGEALAEATGMSVYPGGDPVNGVDWSPEMVTQLDKDAAWNDVRGELWAVLSAAAFLRTCATLGLGIRFSY